MTDENAESDKNFSDQVDLTQDFKSSSNHPNNPSLQVLCKKDDKSFQMMEEYLSLDEQKKVDDVQSDEEEQNFNTENQNKSSKPYPDHNISQFLPQYLSCLYRKNINNLEDAIKFNQEIQSDTKVLSQIQDRIIRNGLFQKCQQFAEQILIHSVQPTKHYEIVAIWIQCGWYKTKILILNNSSAQMEQSPLHSCASVCGFGSFGKLYFINSQKQSYAVKCICTDRYVKDQNQFQEKAEIIVGAFQEYFFLRLFSELEIGPKVKNCFGFDMVVSADCIEFSMEICTRINSNSNIEQKLIENLKTMSLLQIIHRDIKPDNIMWSKSFKKPVFIDFGETRFIKESVGVKKVTKFVGTMRFVSKEMAKIFTQKKGTADLYYNDLFGLKESLKFGVKFQVQQIGIESKHNICQVRSLQILMFLIKYRLLIRDYSEFSRLWQLIEKLYFYEQQAIEYRLLSFMIDLRPNKSLMKLYWRLSEEVRELKQFDELRDIYSGEESNALAIWAKFPLKEQKFKNQILLYRVIARQYQKITSVERKIEIILLSKESVENYLELIQQNFKDQFSQEQKVIIYCVVLSYYCIIGYGKFGIEMKNKVQGALQAIEILKQLKPCGNQSSKAEKQFNFSKLCFLCPLQDFKPIGLFYQYVMFKLWPKIPERFKDECLKIAVTSLTLLGYPFYLKEAKNVFMYFLFKNPSNEELGRIHGVKQKLVNILLFWKVTALIRVYGEVFYHRSKSNFLFTSQELSSIMIQVDDYMQRLMTPSTDINFSILNHNFYQYFNNIHEVKYPSISIHSTIRQLMNKQYLKGLQINWTKYFNQWRQSIFMVFQLMPGCEQMPLEFGIIFDTKPIAFEQGVNIDFTLHFSSFLKYCRDTWNMERLGKMLKIIDQIVNYKFISDRFFIDFRIFCAWKMKDILTLKKLCIIIQEETSKFSVENLENLSQTIMIIHKIILLQRKEFWNEIIENLVCFEHLFKLLKRIQPYILHYTKKEVLLFFIQKHIQTLKNQPSLSSYLPQLQQRYYAIDETTIVYLKLTEQQETLLYIFISIQRALSLLSTIWRFSIIFMNKGLKKPYERSISRLETVDIVTHLRAILPQKLKKSLFLSSQTQAQLRDFIKSSIKLLSSPSLPLNQFYNAEWNLNLKLLLQVPLEERNDFNQIPQIFERNYKSNQVKTKNRFTQMPTIDRNPRISVMYYLSKIVANKLTIKSIEYYNGLISCYNMWRNYDILDKIMFETNMIKYLVNGFIYCESQYSEFLQFLLNVTEVLNKINEKFAVEVFHESIKSKFFCQCKDCFPLLPKNWKPLDFIEYIYSKMSSFNEISHPYMSIALISATLNNFLSIDIKKKFFIFIHKAIEHLTPIARDYICEHLYYEAFLIKATQKGIYFPGKYSTDYKQIKPPSSIKFDKKVIYMQFYHASKQFKSQTRGIDINQLMEQRFILKKKRNPKWKIPQFVENLYRKKIRKYHFVLDGFGNKTSQIYPHMDLLKQFQ